MALLTHKKTGPLAPENLLPLFVVVSLVMGGLSLLGLAILGTVTARLANRPVPTLVQTVDGESILTEPMDHLDRTPETIRRFTADTLTMMFTWNPVQQDANGGRVVTDQGVEVGKARATTRSWQASFALAEDFRPTFLAEVGEMTPPDVFAGTAQSVLNIESLSDPKRLAAGQWEIEVVANLIIFHPQHPQGLAIPFNKKILLKAVEPPSDPLAAEATGIQQAVYRVRSSGLQIEQMIEIVQ
ncbi:MAG: hypothetical protein AAGH67_06610 [Cyanobacteria bacterium P01_H01_bin.162]